MLPQTPKRTILCSQQSNRYRPHSTRPDAETRLPNEFDGHENKFRFARVGEIVHEGRIRRQI